jgi:hypothetical protein
MKALEHFRTITHHRHLVTKGCFEVGLYRQGLLHDLSKYSPVEFLPGCKYYQGNMSPNNAEREDKGYSSAWLHHKGRNKHHMEYWIDYGIPVKKDGVIIEHRGICGMKMPVRYVVEMYVDRVAASKNYQKDKYTDESAWVYYERAKDVHVLHEDTRALLELLLYMLKVKGETVTNRFIRYKVLTGRIPYERRYLALLKKRLELMETEKTDGVTGHDR